MKCSDKRILAVKLVIMRYIQILIFIILISCGNNNTDHPTTELRTESTERINDLDAMKAVMGGPTDISIEVSNAVNSMTYLINSVAGGNFRVDSMNIENGKISIKNDEGFPQGMYYISLPNQKFVSMLLAEDQKFKLSFDANAIVSSMKVEGSKDNELFYENLKYEESYNPRYQAVASQRSKMQDRESNEYKQLTKQIEELEGERTAHLNRLFNGNENSLFVKFKTAGQNPKIRKNGTDEEKVYFYRKEFWDNVDFSDTRLMRTPVVSNKLKRYMTELTPQNKDSIIVYADFLLNKILDHPQYYKYIANWIALQYEPTKTTLMDPEAIFVHMTRNYFTRERAFWSDSMEVYALQQRAGEMVQSITGIKGPDVISTDQFGNTQSIYEKTADYIIVYMYNPTCEHCMKETPKIVDYYNRNKSKGIDVFAIAIDTEDQEWKDYINKNDMSFTNVFDPTNRSIYAKYYVDVTPEIYVLNRDRIIIGKNLKVDQIDIIIDRDRNGS